MRFKLRFIAMLALLLITLAAVPGIASAHERRTVASKYTFVVGFLNEPAIVDQPNGIDLTVTDASTNQPVQGLEKGLKAQIIFGGETENVTLTPRFGMPGKYTAYVIPTKTGTWKFHFTGKINGDNIDELFTSGPGRFNDVEAASTYQFPAKTAPLLDLSNTASSAQSAATSAKTTATIALGVGAAGLTVGVIGLVVAGLALSRMRRASAEAKVATSAQERRIA
jgi:hypothetical protein